MSKSKTMVNKYPRIKLSEIQINKIISDINTGRTKDYIIEHYKINDWQYNDLIHYNNQISKPSLKQAKNGSYNTLNKLKGKSGAINLGKNDICLCGSGKKYKDCCGKNPRNV